MRRTDAVVEEAAEATVTASKRVRALDDDGAECCMDNGRTNTVERRPPANEHLIEIKLAVFGFADGHLSSNHISEWQMAMCSRAVSSLSPSM